MINNKQTEVSENLITAVLSFIRDELDIYKWNQTQRIFPSPFNNTGNSFKNDIFEVNAYYWGDDEKESKKPNFKCGDFEVRWYKYLGRGMSWTEITHDELNKILDKCVKSLSETKD